MIDPARILALVAGELDETEADAVEEHLLGCGECAAYADWLGALGDAVRRLVRDGRLDLIVTATTLARLGADGVALRRYHARPGETIPCSIADERYTVLALDADLAGATRLRAELRGPGGALLHRLDDVPFDPAAGGVLLASRGDRIRALPSVRLTVRLIASDDGAERVVAEYGLDHRATR